MTVVLMSGGLTFIVGMLILGPFSISAGRPRIRAYGPDDDRRRELLRQLRDLDDDLAAGKLTQADHVRLRGPVEREAVALLSHTTQDPVPAAAVITSGTRSASVTVDPQKGQKASLAGRWRHRTMTLLALAGAAAGITVLLINAVSSRAPGQAITGDSVPGVSAAPTVSARPGATAPASTSGHTSPTPQQLAAVVAAQAQVKQNPKDVNAHLALAEAYSAAGANQLAEVEYLVVTRLDPTNAQANTSLALLAFDVGHAAQGKAMVDRVLTAYPDYPEALYVRGVIDLIGLRRPAAAVRDLNAYLAAAPFGSHRTDAVTLLALALSQEHR